VTDEAKWLDRMSPDGRAEFLTLVHDFLETHRQLGEQSQLAGLERDFLEDPEPLHVADYFAAHAAHAGRVADLQLRAGELAAMMAALLRREFGVADDAL
jgi:hypothetical protein